MPPKRPMALRQRTTMPRCRRRALPAASEQLAPPVESPLPRHRSERKLRVRRGSCRSRASGGGTEPRGESASRRALRTTAAEPQPQADGEARGSRRSRRRAKAPNPNSRKSGASAGRSPSSSGPKVRPADGRITAVRKGLATGANAATGRTRTARVRPREGTNAAPPQAAAGWPEGSGSSRPIASSGMAAARANRDHGRHQRPGAERQARPPAAARSAARKPAPRRRRMARSSARAAAAPAAGARAATAAAPWPPWRTGRRPRPGFASAPPPGQEAVRRDCRAKEILGRRRSRILLSPRSSQLKEQLEKQRQTEERGPFEFTGRAAPR